MKTIDEKFYFEGKFFNNEEEFWKSVEEWPLMKMNQETFFRKWEHLGKEIWMNIRIREIEMSNGELNKIIEENFFHLLQKFFMKNESITK